MTRIYTFQSEETRKEICEQKRQRAIKYWSSPESDKHRETCKKNGKNHLGFKVSEKTKKIQSEKMKVRWADQESRNKYIFTIKESLNSEETKTKMKVASKRRFEKQEEREKYKLAASKNHQNQIYRARVAESKGFGFWYGAVRYYDDQMYCEKFNADLKERVRAYRGYVCFECGTPQNGTKLHIHHVHYNKKTCCDGSPHDLVPLCPSCHAKTNTNRKYWEDHFTGMIYQIDLDGKWFFTKEEMASWINMS